MVTTSQSGAQELEQHTNTNVAVILDSIGPEVRVRPIPGANTPSANT